MKKIVFSISFSLLCFHSRAQSISPDSMRLSTAWDVAFQQHPSVRVYELAVAEAIKKMELQENARLPEASAQVQQTYGSFNSVYGAFFPLGGNWQASAPANVEHSKEGISNVFGSAVASWRLFQFGYIRRQIDAAKSFTNIAQNGAALNRLQVQLAVSQAWFSYLYNQKLWQWSSDNYQRLDSLAGIAGALSAAGIRPSADSLLAYAAVSEAGALEQQFSGALSGSTALLRTAMGLPQDSAIGILPVAGAFERTETVATDVPLSMEHPNLMQRKADVAYDSLQAKVAGQSVYPSLSLLGGLSVRGSGLWKDGTVHSGLGDAYNSTYGNYLVGVGVQWQLSNLYNGKKQKEAYLLKMKADDWNYEDQKIKMSGQLANANALAVAIGKKLLSNKQAIANARAAFSLYQVRFQTGIVNLTEVLQIQSILQQAEGAYINDLYAYWMQMALMAYLSNDFSYLSQNF